MPEPSPGEQQDDFIARCVPIVLDDGTADNPDQAIAICHSLWDQSKKEFPMDENERLLELVRNREKKSPFNQGILTADRYVQTIQDIVGIDVCYRHAAKGTMSFSDILKKAAKTLTYNNPDMVLKEPVDLDQLRRTDVLKDVEIPKNILMAFRHVLTTPKKDRDGDILRSEGMEIDPKMLLLWQHVPTLPIGKMLAITVHNSKKIELISCIVDMNDLSHDAAVMIDNKMGRFSHGFVAKEFKEIKGEEGVIGFDVTRAEIMEESLVSIASNTDAETQEILLSLVECGKLTSPLMKSLGREIKDNRPKQIPVKLNVSVNIDGKKVSYENISGSGSDQKQGGDEGKTAAPTQKDVVPEEATTIPEEDKMTGELDQQSTQKSGRVLSVRNAETLKNVRDDISEVVEKEHLISRGGKSLLTRSVKTIDQMLADAAPSEEEESDEGDKGKRVCFEDVVLFMTETTPSSRRRLSNLLIALKDADNRKRITEEYVQLTSIAK